MRTRTPKPVNPIALALREAQRDADIANHHRSNEAADVGRLMRSIDDNLERERGMLRHYEERIAAGKEDERTAIEAELRVADLERQAREALDAFEKAVAAWRVTAAVAAQAKAAYETARDAAA